MFLFLFALLALCNAVRYAKPHFLKHADFVQERMANLATSSSKGVQDIPERWFNQRLNHFGRSHGQTWKQRYWVNEEFYNPSLPGPLFVQFGEEGEASSSMTDAMAMTYYGKDHGALLVAIEHRFYGASQPTGNYADLSLLSVDQGLADFAVVIEYLKTQYNITNTVVFGCSYIGSGAAWFRAKYPQISAGAVASSAPVLAVADFFKYLDQVDLSIREQFGEACDDAIRTAMSTVNQVLLKKDYQSLTSLFSLCAPPKTIDDVRNFVSDLMGTVMGVVQYDFEFGNNNIPKMCAVITNTSSALQGLANFFISQSPDCTDISYQTMITQLRNVTFDPPQNGRQWTYQTCSEFGYFQTTTSTNQPFAAGDWVTLQWYNQICSDAFGSTFDVEANVAETNDRFGGNDLPPYYADNIAYDNSIVDPWHTLSVQHSVNDKSPLFLFDVKGHCSAVSYPSDNDPASIKAVRREIGKLIDKWVTL